MPSVPHDFMCRTRTLYILHPPRPCLWPRSQEPPGRVRIRRERDVPSDRVPRDMRPISSLPMLMDSLILRTKFCIHGRWPPDPVEDGPARAAARGPVRGAYGLAWRFSDEGRWGILGTGEVG
jgi:hypothetical protein